MFIALIANPHASRFSGRQRDRVVAAIGARHRLELLQTGHPGQATELAARAVADGTEVVAGGRGPPAAPDRATARLLDLLATGARRRLTLGVAGERCFALNAGLGLGGAIVREVERRQRAKQLYGDRAYVAAGLKALLVDQDRDHQHLTVHLPDGQPPLRGFFALVGNGDPFTYLGRRPFRPTPQATWDGGLDLLVGQTMATRSLARAVTGMLSPHPRAGYPGLPVLHDIDGFSLSADIPLPFQVDGEYVGDRTSVTFGSLRSALSVVAPPTRA